MPSEYAKKYAIELVEEMFDGSDIKTAVNRIKSDIKNSISKTNPDEIGVPKGLVKKLGEYKNRHAWARGSEYSNYLFNTKIDFVI